MQKMLGLFCLLLLLLGACEEKNEPLTSEKYQVKGKVEKGPFIKGSEIQIYELDDHLKQTGVSYAKTILDNEGNFDFGELRFRSPFVELVAKGSFFNEVTGETAVEGITLHAIADLSDQKEVHVNVLTDLERDRMVELRNQGMKFQEAIRQANKEILSTFGLQRFEEDAVSKYSLTAGNTGTGILLVTSVALLKDKSGEQLTAYLSELREDFRKNGGISAEKKEAIRVNAVTMDWEQVTSNLVRKYQQTGRKIDIPELSYYIDWNGDGVAGEEVGDIPGGKKLKFETDTLRVASEGGEYTVNIAANLAYDFTYPGMEQLPESSIESENLFEFESEKMDYTVELDKLHGQLKVVVKPAKGYLIDQEFVTLYSGDGKTETTLVISQSGDLSKFQMPEKMKLVVAGVLEMVRNSADYLYTIEAYYTQCYPEPQHGWQKFYTHHPELQQTEELRRAWSKAYEAIANANNACDRLSELEFGDYCTPVFKTLRSMMYYPLVVLWGNIPYPVHYSTDSIAQLTEKEAYERLTADLENNYYTIMDWKMGENQNYEDVNTLLLGKVYMQLKNYPLAGKWLHRFLGSEKYTLNQSRQDALNSGSTELVFGIDLTGYNSVYATQIANNRYLPVGSYTEGLLLMAECLEKQEKHDEALEYLNQVHDNYQLPKATTVSGQLKQTWKELLRGEFSYFAFLKRNDLAEAELGIKSYQKLLPFPSSEVDLGGAKQNPGY